MTRLTNQPKQIILCADDYAQNSAISEGIYQLASKGRINAISCMVNSKEWSNANSLLHSLSPSVFVGLHLNLTLGEPVSPIWQSYYGKPFPGLPLLLTKAYLRKLNAAVVAAEIQAQFDVFIKAMNRYPDFIDGHEHCHQLPVIRDVLLQNYNQNHDKSFSRHSAPEGILPAYEAVMPAIFIRSTSNGWRDVMSTHDFPKRQLISILGGATFKKCLVNKSLSTNTSFSGIYNFNKSSHYRHYFNKFLSFSQNRGLIMCHPGMPSNDVNDPLSEHRHHELNYLLSEEFVNDLFNHSIELGSKETFVW